MKLDEHIKLWNQAAIKIWDIRHVVMQPGELLEDYMLPSSGFIYSVRGAGHLKLDGREHEAQRFHVLHGGKGMRLDVWAEEEFEYYLLLYRAVYALPGNKELARLMERHQPFALQYGFLPEEPLPLLRPLELIRKAWQNADDLDRIQIKGLFYQFIHELLRQMKTQGIKVSKPDLVTQAIRYMEEHFQEGITLETLGEKLNYSPRHLSMRFKEHTGASPIHYLIQIRVKRAAELLIGTDAALNEIALEVGYADVYYFSRIFKKHTGLSPVRFQERERKKRLSEDRPFILSEISIGTGTLRRYIGNYDNHYQYKRGGSVRMKRNTTSGLAISLLLTLTLLLGACSSGAANTSSNAGASASPSNTTESASPAQNDGGQASPAEAATRIISTEKGDVEVPAEPKRVVALYMLGDVVAMGVKPVGISDVYEGAAFEQELAGIETLGEWFEPNQEAVLALDPDLIIAPSEDTYNKLHEIAPTVYIPFDKMTTEERMNMLGKVFGKEQEVKTLMENFNKKVEESKEKLKAAGVYDKTVSIIEGGKKQMSVISSKQYGRGSQIIYEYLGMKAPKVIQDKIDVATVGNGENVSLEVLPEYTGDYIFRSSWMGMDDLSDNSIWNSIPAIKEGRLIEIEFGLAYYSDIYSLDKQLDFIVEKLLEKAPKA
ncbi:iron complex transport system substrate-binding protein [Paenibacillus algorifonticola]|uniref:Iron complex transport system substrate-binding protein n=1 Tax=Paenibacillus algorifonticola TaxID=684063 RepID=A0A1I2GPY3_9BACL|nr:AraC family transcriptional regulator [Paenibacillus algorifonticola]SFF19080.1 iron complex transport system substrate-binding protein [Paenibacillus algorifonticola]